MNFTKSSAKNSKNTDFFFKQSWRILSTEFEEHKKLFQPPENICDTEKAYFNLLVSSKKYQYYKTKRNRFFKEICDFSENLTKKFENESKLTEETKNFVFEPDKNLFASKKNRKINEINEAFRQTALVEKARKTIINFKNTINDIKKNSDIRSLKKIIINEDLDTKFLSFHESKKVLSFEKQVSQRKTKKLSSIEKEKKSQNFFSFEDKILQRNKFLSSEEKIPDAAALKTFELKNRLLINSRESNKTQFRNSFYITTQPKSSQISKRVNLNLRRNDVAISTEIQEKLKKRATIPIVDTFIINFEYLKKMIKFNEINALILKKIKHLKLLKSFLVEEKKLKSCINREYIYDILKQGTIIFQNDEIFPEKRNKQTFLKELFELNKEIETYIIQKNKEELNYKENALINSYENYKMKESSFHKKQEKNKNNFYKNATFEHDMELIKKDLDNDADFGEKLEVFEHNYGVCHEIDNKQKKVMKNMDCFYKELRKRFEYVNDTYKEENPYFIN